MLSELSWAEGLFSAQVLTRFVGGSVVADMALVGPAPYVERFDLIGLL